MNEKTLVSLGVVIIGLMLAVPVFSIPENAVDKNPNLSYVTVGEEGFIVMENGAGTKKAWCVDGPNEGEALINSPFSYGIINLVIPRSTLGS